jgi:adiponectin receptor
MSRRRKEDDKMVCTSPALTVESSYEEITTAATVTGREDQKPNYRRRHSSFHPRRKSCESVMDGEESLLLKVYCSFQCLRGE